MPGLSPISTRAFSTTPARLTRAGGGFSPRSARTVRRRSAELRGPPWAKPPAASSNGAPAAALDAEALRRATSELDPRPAADPRLPGARPSRSRSRPARPRQARTLSRARLPQLRLRRGRSRSRNLSQRRFRAGARQPEPDHRDAAAHVLRHDRGRIHAHPGAGRARLDPAENSRRASAVRRCRRPTARKSSRS